MVDTRTILLIGKTGNGKSTIANILTNTNRFTENSQLDGSEAVQKEELEINGIHYQIVEAVGVGDSQLSPQQVLYKLASISHSIATGINQIFFVTDGNFTKEELEMYDLLSSVVFGEGIDDYLTIVRTKFPTFSNEQACEIDRQRLKDNYSELIDRISSIDKIIYVDNLPLTHGQVATEARQFSQERLFNHLANCQNVYKEHLQQFEERVRDFR